MIVSTVPSRHYYCGIDVSRRSGSSKKVAQTRLLRDNPMEVGVPGHMGCSHYGGIESVMETNGQQLILLRVWPALGSDH